MKKLFLLIGLVVFLTPMVVNAETKVETTNSSSNIYTLIGTVIPHTLPNLQSPKAELPFWKFGSGNLIKYEIIESKIVNNEEWIHVRSEWCKKCIGWTNEKDKFIKLLSEASTIALEKNDELLTYIIKSKIASYTKPSLKSKRSYSDLFYPYSGGETAYKIGTMGYTVYKIIESKTKNNVEWIKVCPYSSDGSIVDRSGNEHDACGWTNEINKFHLVSSLQPELTNVEEKKVVLPESDLIHSYCIDNPSTWEMNCFCKRPDNSVFKQNLKAAGINVIDYCASERYNNKKITLKEYLENGGEYKLTARATSVDNTSSLFIYCKNTDSEFDYVSAWPVKWSPCPGNDVQVSLDVYNENKQKRLKSDLEWEERLKNWNLDRTARNSRGNIQTRSKRLTIKLSKYNEFAIALGCGINKKDVDYCVARYLPATIGSGPLTIDQINEVKKDEELMGEVVFAIEEMNRALDESNQPTEEEQKQAKAQEQAQAQQTEGYYTEQPNGQFVWVDTRSGYQKFTDNFCVGCNATQVYMINRATKKYYQGAPLSGWDKFVLRGGNSRRVIRFYR